MLFDPNRFPGPKNAGLRASGPLSPFVRFVIAIGVVAAVTAIVFAIVVD